MENKIDVTHLDVVRMVQEAYNLSTPQGLGFLHYEPQDMTYEEAENIAINASNRFGDLSLDYVKGRAVKFDIYGENGKLYINKSWYDHTDEDLQELLKRVAG